MGIAADLTTRLALATLIGLGAACSDTASDAPNGLGIAPCPSISALPLLPCARPAPEGSTTNDGGVSLPNPGQTTSLHFAPADVTSSMSVKNPSLVRGVPSDPAVIIDPHTMSLKTYPELADVEAVVADLGNGGGVEVVPAQPLAARWYVIATSAPPPGAVILPALPPLANVGSYYARFTTAATPVRRSVALCGKPTVMRVVAEFSEPILWTPTSFEVRDAATNAVCVQATAPGQVPADTTYYFDCPTHTDGTPASRIRFVMDGTARSANGDRAAGTLRDHPTTSDEVIDITPHTETFDFSSVDEWSGCRTLYR